MTGFLWRLCRAHAVETGLLDIQGRLQREVRIARPTSPDQSDMLTLLGLSSYEASDAALDEARQDTEAKARAFLRLCNINGSAFDLLNRYEVSLWRQAVQLMIMLEGSVHPLAAITVAKQSQ